MGILDSVPVGLTDTGSMIDPRLFQEVFCGVLWPFLVLLGDTSPT